MPRTSGSLRGKMHSGKGAYVRRVFHHRRSFRSIKCQAFRPIRSPCSKCFCPTNGACDGNPQSLTPLTLGCKHTKISRLALGSTKLIGSASVMPRIGRAKRIGTPRLTKTWHLTTLRYQISGIAIGHGVFTSSRNHQGSSQWPPRPTVEGVKCNRYH